MHSASNKQRHNLPHLKLAHSRATAEVIDLSSSSPSSSPLMKVPKDEFPTPTSTLYRSKTPSVRSRKSKLTVPGVVSNSKTKGKHDKLCFFYV